MRRPAAAAIIGESSRVVPYAVPSGAARLLRDIGHADAEKWPYAGERYEFC